MLEYTLELEQKIAEGNLAGENTLFVLALCGDGFHWQQDGLEDFGASTTVASTARTTHFPNAS